jgi:hypothetical protein
VTTQQAALGQVSAERTPSRLATTLFTHVRFDSVLEQLRSEIADPHGAPIILLVAPPGFGKTKLLQVLENVVTFAHRDAMLGQPDLRPAITVEALAPIVGSFHWPLHLARILEALDEPGVGWRGPASEAEHLGPLMRYRRNRDIKDLLLDTTAALRAHGTILLSTDEARHLAMVRDVRRHYDQLETIKSLANESGTRILLAGAYDMLDFRHLSAQLARRTVEIHAPRYRADQPRELREFRRVATQMLAAMEGPETASDDRLTEMLYRGSLGCVGNLHHWLVRAEREVVKGAALDDALTMTGWSRAKIKSMAVEITDGERRLAADDEVDLAGVDHLLGIRRAQAPAAMRARRPTARKPGERRPERDLSSSRSERAG